MLKQVVSWFLVALWISPLLKATTASGPEASDSKEATALLNKAIRATGGEAKLARFKAATWKARGTAYDNSMAIPFMGEWATEAPDRKRSVIEGEVNGEKFKFISVVNGPLGWLQMNGNTDEMNKDELAGAEEETYADNLTRLVPLKDRAITLVTVPEIKVNDRPALGLRANRKNHLEVLFYFDKETFLLVKVETHVKDKSGKDFLQETIFSGQREIQEIKVPTKFAVRRDGKILVKGEVYDYHLEEKLDDALFGRP